MNVIRKEDIPHKIALYRLLERILSNPKLATNLYFKGGTCAAMLGLLDRFSVDLDFDLLDSSLKPELRQEIHRELDFLGFRVKDESKEQLQFFIKYRDIPNQRSVLKLEITDLAAKANTYHKSFLVEINKYCNHQDISTMFANKLVALKARFEEGKGISGRDMYDINHFFKSEHDINISVVEELRGMDFAEYIKELVEFINKEVTEKVLMEDLNPLVNKKDLNKLVPFLKMEVLLALNSL